MQAEANALEEQADSLRSGKESWLGVVSPGGDPRWREAAVRCTREGAFQAPANSPVPELATKAALPPSCTRSGDRMRTSHLLLPKTLRTFPRH